MTHVRCNGYRALARGVRSSAHSPRTRPALACASDPTRFISPAATIRCTTTQRSSYSNILVHARSIIRGCVGSVAFSNAHRSRLMYRRKSNSRETSRASSNEEKRGERKADCANRSEDGWNMCVARCLSKRESETRILSRHVYLLTSRV